MHRAAMVALLLALPLTAPAAAEERLVRDYTRFAGFAARIETDSPVDGRRRFQGRIGGLEDGVVVVKGEKETFRVPYARINRAKLILTDDLIAATAPPAATH